MLWTTIVTDRGVSPLAFGLLLGLYMLVYQIDELVIFAVAVATMRVTKLQERQGRLLKLLSGMLMLSLAAVMLVEPALLNDVRTSLLVFAAAGAATALILVVEHRFRSPQRVARMRKPDGDPLSTPVGWPASTSPTDGSPNRNVLGERGDSQMRPDAGPGSQP